MMLLGSPSGSQSHSRSMTVVCEIPKAGRYHSWGTAVTPGDSAGSGAFLRSGGCPSPSQLLSLRCDSSSSQGPPALLLALQVRAGSGPLPSSAGFSLDQVVKAAGYTINHPLVFPNSPSNLQDPGSWCRAPATMKTIIAACSQNLSGSRASVQTALHTLLRAPWPSQRNLRSWMQRLAVLQWVLSFLLLGIVSLLVLIYLVFTSFWAISALYLAWIIFDWDTPERGGRRLACLRGWPIWNHFRDYFPVKLVKTHELSPSHNYIIGSHPHGILCVGAFCNFVTGSTGFGQKFPGIRPSLTTLAGNFRLPLFREYLMSGGLCPVTRSAMGYLLAKNGTGNAVAIVIGGAAESLSCRPGVTTLILKNRKGFVRMALEHGAYLVPSFTFGENDLYHQVVFKEGSWMRSIQSCFQKLIGFAPCVFYGRALTSVQSRGLLPYEKPITTVVGEPLVVPKVRNPSSEMVDTYHQMYISSLIKLFHENKTKYGMLETDELHIL